MTTWGPSKKRDALDEPSTQPSGSRSTRRATSRLAAPRRPRRRPVDASAARRGVQAGATGRPPSCARRVDGREHEFVGIGLIVGGVAARPRRCTSTSPVRSAAASRRSLGWLSGSAATPCRSCSSPSASSLVRKGRSSSPSAWSSAGRSSPSPSLGLLHVINGPDELHRPRRARRRRRLLGALVGEPLRGAARRPARSSCCSASASAARCSSPRPRCARWPTRTGARRRHGRPAARPGRPPGAPRPLVAEQRPTRRRTTAPTPRSSPASRSRCRRRPSYDAADDFADDAPAPPAPRRRKPRRRREPPVGAGRRRRRRARGRCRRSRSSHRTGRPDDQPGRGRGARPGAPGVARSSTASRRRSSA